MSEHPVMPAALKRRLGLPLLVLYGVGITIGAGIYVLIGAVAAHAGRYAPWSFLLAAGVMAFTVGSYAELATRFPVSAGEAAYVRQAFGSRTFSRMTGLLTIVVALIASSTVAVGAAGYLSEFISFPTWSLVAGVLLLLGLVAAWGILESVLIASMFTLIEVGGLLAIIFAGFHSGVSMSEGLTIPPLDASTLAGVGYASLLAFFAFIGFEDLANVVEEAKMPHRDIPLAMGLTLLIATTLYLGVAVTAVWIMPPDRLAASKAPLSQVFQALTGASPMLISLIAISATFNTILAQISMAARVIYGMARQGDLPAWTGHVHSKTATPVLATAFIVAASLTIALLLPFERLAESTSVATLLVFAMVNLSLLWLRFTKMRPPGQHVRVPIFVPAGGLVTCVAMISATLAG
jgi:basic amino acid/polyamine antiporter, APA family